MNQGTLHECRHPRCGNYAIKGGVCFEHRALYTQQVAGPPGSNLKPSNSRFRWMRAAYLMRNPICACCHQAAAHDLDHIRPHRGNVALFWDQTNWQGLCVRCHRQKTARETIHTEAEAGASPFSFNGVQG